MRAAILVLLAASIVTPSFAAELDPVLDGKPLSEWAKLFRQDNETDRKRAEESLGTAVERDRIAAPIIVQAILTPDQARADGPALLRVVGRAGSAALPVLLRTIWSDNSESRVLAFFALRDLGEVSRPAIAPLIQALADRDPMVVRLAANTLGRLGVHHAIPHLLPLLQHDDVIVQVEAQAALLELAVDPKLLMPALEKRFASNEAIHRRVAVKALSEFGREAPAAVPLLMRATQEPELREDALRGLGRAGSIAKEAVPILLAGLKDESWAADRLNAAEALWFIARHPEAIATFKRELTAKDGSRQIRAAKWLWLIAQDPVAMETLAAVLKDGSPKLQTQAADVVIRIGPPAKATLPALIPLIESKDPFVRRTAVLALGRLGQQAKPAIEALTKALEDPVPAVRSEVVATLWEVAHDPRALAELRTELKSKDPSTRFGAIATLQSSGKHAAPAVPELTEAMKDADPSVRLAAAVALWRIARHSDAPSVIAAELANAPAAQRSDAALALGAEGPSEVKVAVPALRRALWDNDAFVRGTAAEALGRIGPDARDAVSALSALLRSDGPDYVLTGSAEALGLIGKDAVIAVQLLRERLNHPNGYVRALSALSLWHIGKNKDGAAVAEAAMSHRRGMVRITAAEARWHIAQDPRSVPTLQSAMQDAALLDDVSTEHYMAVRALGRIGPAAKAAVPDLLRRLDELDPNLRTAAAEAIQRIDPTAMPKKSP